MPPGKRKKEKRKEDDFTTRVLRNFQTLIPDWPLYILYGLIIGALESLRHHIGSEDTPDVSWENPFAELQLPVRYDWKENHVIFIDEYDEKHAAEREEEFIDSVIDHHMVHVLWKITNGAALSKEGSEVFPILEKEVWDVIDSLPEAEAGKKLAELYRPYPIGFAIERLKEEIDKGGSVSDNDTVHGRMKGISPLGFACSVGADKVAGNMIFVFLPLVVDVGEHRAYYPILTGLVFDDPDAPLQMSQSEQGEFWEHLFQMLNDICEEVLPAQSVEGKEFLSVVLGGIDERIFPYYAPWIRSTHESALAYFQKTGTLPALMLSQHMVPGEPDQRETSDKREQYVSRFPMLPDLGWKEVAIAFKSHDYVVVSARDQLRRYHYAELGFADKRKGDKPNTLWLFLKDLAKLERISWRENIDQETRSKAQKKISDIRRILKNLMGVDDDPFHPYSSEDGWRPKFCLTDDSFSDLE